MKKLDDTLINTVWVSKTDSEKSYNIFKCYSSWVAEENDTGHRTIRETAEEMLALLTAMDYEYAGQDE